MGNLKNRTLQAWHSTSQYRISTIIVQILFASAGFWIRWLLAGGTVAMSELLSWIEWVLLPALMGFVAMFLWHFFRDPYVQVIAEVEVIEVYENYTPPGLREGDYKHITLDVVLIPSKPVTVSEVRLILSGKQFDATVFSYNPITGLEITPFSKIRIDTKTKLTLFFDAQNECRTKTNKAQVIAVANNINRCSEPFIIKLDGEYRHMSNIMRRSG